VFIGILTGIAGAAFYVVFRPWLAWAARWRGVAFGVVLFAVGSATSDVLNPDNVDFVILGNEALVVGLIVALFVGFGALIEPVAAWLDRRLPEPGRSRPLLSAAFASFAALGLLLGAVMVLQAMFTRSFCDCDPPILASIALLVTGAGTVAWALSAFSSSDRLPTVARTLGTVGLLGATAAGLARAIGDAAAVLRG
jgi:hypothetical protein